MRLYLRLLLNEEGPHSPEGQERLRAFLSSAPCSVRVDSITPHHKGGYSVVTHLDQASVRALLDHLEACGVHAAL